MALDSMHSRPIKSDKIIILLVNIEKTFIIRLQVLKIIHEMQRLTPFALVSYANRWEDLWSSMTVMLFLLLFGNMYLFVELL